MIPHSKRLYPNEILLIDSWFNAGGYCNSLQYLGSLLASLDVLTSFAMVAASAPTPYIRPNLLEANSGTIVLEKTRHPCVEMQDSISFIPNDVHFQQGIRIILQNFLISTDAAFILCFQLTERGGTPRF
jgi:DNA mismatch repair protein MSH2